MPRIRKAEVERTEAAEALTLRLEGMRMLLDPGSAAALAVLSIRWGLSPAQAMRRALLGVATGLGELPKRGEIKGGG